MEIFRSAFEAGRRFPGAVVAIGKFDALHRGHRTLIRLARSRARRLKAPCLVLTFDPSPEQFVRLFRYRPLLSLGEKLDRLRRLGVDGVVLLPFDSRLACLSPTAFARDVLARQLMAMSVFVGENFCFGQNRAGRVDDLSSLGKSLSFSVHPIPEVKAQGVKISAERIRDLLAQGRRGAAEKLLGRKLPRSPTHAGLSLKASRGGGTGKASPPREARSPSGKPESPRGTSTGKPRNSSRRRPRGS